MLSITTGISPMRCRSSTLYLGPITVLEEKSFQLQASAPTSRLPVHCYPRNSVRSHRSASCCDEKATLQRNKGSGWVFWGNASFISVMGGLMNQFARTDQAYGLALTRRSRMSRIFLVVVWTIAVGGGSTVSGAQSNSTPAERKAEQVVQPINFRQPAPLDFEDHVGFVRIFDGTSLKDWDGDPSFWHVENGAIVGVSTKEHPVGNTYIVYRGFEAKDFDLKLEIKVENGGGSGVQYRSKT